MLALRVLQCPLIELLSYMRSVVSDAIMNHPVYGSNNIHLFISYQYI